MTKWNLIVDVANCTNCSLCTLALQDEHVGNAFPGFAEEMPKHGHRWIDIKRRERGSAPMTDVAYLPVMCQHCDDAPCIAAAENDAIQKRPDGIVVIDPEKAKGQKQIVDACPYGAVWWNEEKQVPQHWFFDAHLLDAGWDQPRCVTVCATGALKAVKADDAEMARIAGDEGLEPLRPDLATQPRVHYKNLWRYDKHFVGGTVSAESGGVIDCVAGARVTLTRGAETLGEATTDGFGDFKIDRLDAGDGYALRVEAEGFDTRSTDIELVDSINIGEIRLEARA